MTICPLSGAGKDHRRTVSATQLRTAPAGVEQLRIHAPAENLDVPEAALDQVVPKGGGGDQGGVRSVVKAPQALGDWTFQQTETVVGAVLVKLGVEAGQSRNRERAGGGQCRVTKRPLGGDVDHVRQGFAPHPLETPIDRKSESQVAIPRNGQARHQGLGPPVYLVQGSVAVLARTDQLDAVAPLLEPLDEVAQGVGNAVDLGGICLGDHTHGQRQPPGIPCHALLPRHAAPTVPTAARAGGCSARREDRRVGARLNMASRLRDTFHEVA